MKLDVTITATRRADLLYKTLESFFDNMLKYVKDKRAIVNIDPAGIDEDSSAVESVIRSFFPEHIIMLPTEPNFPLAFKRCWEKCTAEYVFHLEDDWQLLRPISPFDMAAIMKNHGVAALRLPRWRLDETASKNWGHWFPWNGQYFECPREKVVEIGFAGHPSLITGRFVKETAPLLDPTSNPEKQFHYNKAIAAIVAKNKFGVYGKPNESPAIREIGEDWKRKNGFVKDGNKAFFTNWRKI